LRRRATPANGFPGDRAPEHRALIYGQQSGVHRSSRFLRATIEILRIYRQKPLREVYGRPSHDKRVIDVRLAVLDTVFDWDQARSRTPHGYHDRAAWPRRPAMANPRLPIAMPRHRGSSFGLGHRFGNRPLLALIWTLF